MQRNDPVYEDLLNEAVGRGWGDGQGRNKMMSM